MPPGTPQYALDLGMGNGRDTLYLHNLGFNVVGVDPEPYKVDQLPAGIQVVNQDRLEYVMAHPKRLTYGLVNAQWVFPFMIPDLERLAVFVEQVGTLMFDEGILCGQLFGPNDFRVKKGNGEVLAMEQGDFYRVMYAEESFKLIRFSEIEEHKAPPHKNTPQHQHYFEFIAQKQAPYKRVY